MKWIIIGPFFDDTFQENVAFTLRRMGQDVITMPPTLPKRYHSRVRSHVSALRDNVLPTRVPADERWLRAAVKAHRPDVLLALTQTVTEDTLFELKKVCGIRRVAWWTDPACNMRRMGLLSDQWDVIFLKESEFAAKFRTVGLNCHLLHEAMNPAWHKPLAGQSNDSVVVAGSFYAYRQFLVLRLLRENIPVDLYGAPLPRWAHPEIRRKHSGRYIVKEEKSRVFGAALACLNSSSVTEGNCLNCRAFEVAAAGGLQLIEHKPVLEECFDPGKELLAFKSLPELLGHIDQARRHPRDVVAIRAAGARRALAEHTYEHRLRVILQTLDL